MDVLKWDSGANDNLMPHETVKDVLCICGRSFCGSYDEMDVFFIQGRKYTVIIVIIELL